MEHKAYDYIIIGGGLSGLQLAYHILEERALRDRRVLLIERDRKNKNDRTWSFWSRPDRYTPPMEHAVWDRYIVAYGDEVVEQTFAPYRYYSIQSSAFYRHVHQAIDESNQITYLQDEVYRLEQHKGIVHLASGQKVKGSILFNGAYHIDEIEQKEEYTWLWQHFKGWVVKTERPIFQPDVAHIMDFRTEQYGEVRFFYTLPRTPHVALIEYTVFGKEILDDASYDNALKKHMHDLLQGEDYEILEVEKGAIPMTDYPFMKDTVGKEVPIGTRGGFVKASTGYAFSRTLSRTRWLVDALKKDPMTPPDISCASNSYRFKIYDSIFLDVMARDRHPMDKIFFNLYKLNPHYLVFKFLDEETSFLEELKIMNACPFDFYKSFFTRMNTVHKL